MSTRRSRSHKSPASISSWIRPNSAMASSNASPSIVASSAESVSNRSRTPRALAIAGAIASSTVSPSSVGSWGRYPTDAPGAGRASPSKASSTPAMIFISVDFPAPFWPTTPIFAPGKKQRSTLSRIVREPSGVFLFRPASVNMYWRVTASKRSSCAAFFSCCFGCFVDFLNLFSFLPFLACRATRRAGRVRVASGGSNAAQPSAMMRSRFIAADAPLRAT
mmetsp:Transcript_8314/g.25998  ORF Transcript_8314/g.25998 Transcript_8314/m.25998 type:complete len:221 (+) Transcript_8314:1361-2023(+)